MVSEGSGLNHGLGFDAVGSGETEGWVWRKRAGLGGRGLGLEGGGWAWREGLRKASGSRKSTPECYQGAEEQVKTGELSHHLPTGQIPHLNGMCSIKGPGPYQRVREQSSHRQGALPTSPLAKKLG